MSNSVEKLAKEYGDKMKVLRGQFVGTAERLAMAYIEGYGQGKQEADAELVEALRRYAAMTFEIDQHGVGRVKHNGVVTVPIYPEETWCLGDFAAEALRKYEENKK